jgi:hypothetical protein
MKFASVYDDEPLVVKTRDGLPPLAAPDPGGAMTLPRYEYLEIPPPTTHMKITAKQIIKGLKGKDAQHGSTSTLNAVPKHLFASSGTQLYQAPGMGWKQYKHAWGICAVQGWALHKILLSVMIILIIGLGFLVVWLVCISKTDLQNGSVPLVLMLTMVCLISGLFGFFQSSGAK